MDYAVRGEVAVFPVVSFNICQLSVAIKRSRRRENKAIAKDKVDHTSTRPRTPWTTAGPPVQLLEERKSRFRSFERW